MKTLGQNSNLEIYKENFLGNTYFVVVEDHLKNFSTLSGC